MTRDRKNFLHVRGEGDLDRLVPIIEPALWRRLQRFVRGRPAGAASDRLFLGLKRRAGQDELLPLTESGVQQMIRQAAREAGMTKRVHPHLFRYSAATWMRTKRVDPLTIARVMGWTSLRMLQRIYDQASPTDHFEAMAGLLQSVRQFKTPQDEPQRRRAHEIAAHHYFLLRSFFRAVGRFDLATMCADRGLSAAEAADNPILIAGGQWNVATVLLIDDRASLGHEIAVQAANAIAPMCEKDSQAAAMYGALHLTAASSAARAGQLDLARDHIWQHAEPVARMTGEANVMWTQFGPLNVQVIAVGVETALANSADALCLADRVDAARLPSVERRVKHLLEVARSYEQRAEDLGVLHYLSRAEREAPEDLMYQPLAASLVQGLLARSRPMLLPDVEALARRAGLQN